MVGTLGTLRSSFSSSTSVYGRAETTYGSSFSYKPKHKLKGAKRTLRKSGQAHDLGVKKARREAKRREESSGWPAYERKKSHPARDARLTADIRYRDSAVYAPSINDIGTYPLLGFPESFAYSLVISRVSPVNVYMVTRIDHRERKIYVSPNSVAPRNRESLTSVTFSNGASSRRELADVVAPAMFLDADMLIRC